eukprot:SAG11_NODE_3584_length_2351_cov_7.509325_2_plen_62_part_00
MTLGMYYEIREDDLYLDYVLYHHHRARGHGPRPDHFYQIPVYYYIEDLHKAAGTDSGNLGS